MNKKFINLLTGITLTNLGDSIFLIAIPMLLFQKTQNYSYISILKVIILIPMIAGFVFSPLVTKMSRKSNNITVLQVIQIVSMSISFYFLANDVVENFGIFLLSIAIFTASNYILYLLVGTIVPKISKEDELYKNNSLISLSKNTGNAIADSAGSIIVANFSIMVSYFSSVVTYIISLFFFVNIKYTQENEKKDEPENAGLASIVSDYFNELIQNSKIVFKNKNFIGMIALSFLSKIIFAIQIMNTLGYFQSIGKNYLYGFQFTLLFVGIIIGNIIVSKIKDKIDMNKFVVISNIALALCYFVLLYFASGYGVLVSTFLMGVYSGIIDVVFTTDIQLESKDDFPSVMSFVFSVVPLGEFLIVAIFPVFVVYLNYVQIFYFIPVLFLISGFIYKALRQI